MSRQTTEARAVAREAGRAWRVHQASCPTCQHAARIRRPGDRCEAGRDLWRAWRAADTERARNVEADRQPGPGQSPLPGMPAPPQARAAGRGRRPEGKRGAARGGGRR